MWIFVINGHGPLCLTPLLLFQQITFTIYDKQFTDVFPGHFSYVAFLINISYFTYFIAFMVNVTV